MAKQKGVHKLKGKLDGLSYYRSNGEDLVKLPGGASKEQIMSEPQFVRTRENMSEFSGSAMVGKGFRLGVSEVYPEFRERFTSSRLVTVFRAVVGNGPGVRGERDIEIVNNKLMMIGFNFNRVKTLGSIFSAPYTFTTIASRDETKLIVADFNTSNFIHAPAGATHFRFVNTASVLSDYTFNTSTKKYEAVNPTIEGLNAVAASSYIPLGGMVGSTTTVTATIAGSITMVPTAGLMGCFGIEFFQVVNTVYYLLNAENAMRIENVF